MTAAEELSQSIDWWMGLARSVAIELQHFDDYLHDLDVRRSIVTTCGKHFKNPHAKRIELEWIKSEIDQRVLSDLPSPDMTSMQHAEFDRV